MKIKERALSLLLSLVMVLTFMPALAFADSTWSATARYNEVTLSGGTAESPGTATLEVVIDNGDYTGEYTFAWYKIGEGEEQDTYIENNTATLPVNAEGTYYCMVSDADYGTNEVNFYVKREEWSLDYNDREYLGNGPVTLRVDIDGCPYGITYQWHKWDSNTETEIPISGETNNTLTVSEEGWYDCLVKDDQGIEKWAEIWVRYPEEELDYYGISSGGLWFELHDARNEALGADVWGNGASGSVTIPADVTLANGKTYPVKYVYSLGNTVTSANIPASVTSLSDVGYYWNYDPATDNETRVPVPGFVIYGTNGSPAHNYAIQNGILFSDLVNGTPDGNIAKVKISKPGTAKKAISVKWKKFTKKQLKKSGKISYEIWVATDAGFTNVIKTVTAGKKKSSKKIKVPSKGTYYVKVRAIKQDGIYKKVGAWSKTKKVKVKK